MAKRITIMLDDELDKKLRKRQAKTIAQQGKSYSFSRALCDTLKEVI